MKYPEQDGRGEGGADQQAAVLGLGGLNITDLQDVAQAAREFAILVDAFTGLSDRAIYTVRRYARAEPGSENFETFLDAISTARKKPQGGSA